MMELRQTGLPIHVGTGFYTAFRPIRPKLEAALGSERPAQDRRLTAKGQGLKKNTISARVYPASRRSKAKGRKKASSPRRFILHPSSFILSLVGGFSFL
jgi:hypothetical protein